MPDEPAEHTTVATSKIAGNGLHATAILPAGSVAMLLASAPAAADELGPVNHSCDPNLGWAGDRTLRTVREVAAGDELTVDYATTITDPGFVMFCHCETYRCRQVIEGTDWQISQLQQRYEAMWAPRVAERIAERITDAG